MTPPIEIRPKLHCYLENGHQSTILPSMCIHHIYNVHTIISREMFCHINKKGMEVILHYLFNKLDSHLAYEEFR